MTCILHLALLAAVGFVAYEIGKAVGYDEAMSQKHGGRYCHG
jgi:hypothetical protein